jgi:CheY-like chemotaxis protein
MDIRLPGMDGYEATRRIREFNKDLVIIAQTAFGLLSERQKALDAGCSDYISKPINMNALFGILNKYFDK